LEDPSIDERIILDGNVKLSLYLTKHQAVKTYGGMEVYLHEFLTSALEGGEWLVSRTTRFTPGERT
jgi:hypothetical protein